LAATARLPVYSPRSSSAIEGRVGGCRWDPPDAVMIAEPTHFAAIAVMDAPRPRLSYSLGIRLAFQFLRTSPRWQPHVVGSECKSGMVQVRTVCPILSFAVLILATVDFLHVYTVATDHQINLTTNKLSLLNGTIQSPQAVREYT